jgi:putative SOS response-associated peptidase YedK
MCGRIALYSDPDRLARIFDAVVAAGLDPPGLPSYNIGPSRSVLGLVATSAATGRPGVLSPPPDPGATAARTGTVGTGAAPRRVIEQFRWGLVPSWARDPSIGNRLFNARGETVAEKPSFRSAFAARRTAVLADGFYEWAAVPGERKQAYFLRRADGMPLALAGLWEHWSPPGGAGDPIVSCTIVTTAAGDDLRGIHDRMPVVLEEPDVDRWLDPAASDPGSGAALLRSAPAGTLLRVRVGPAVGQVRNDGPQLIEPVADP